MLEPSDPSVLRELNIERVTRITDLQIQVSFGYLVCIVLATYSAALQGASNWVWLLFTADCCNGVFVVFCLAALPSQSQAKKSVSSGDSTFVDGVGIVRPYLGGNIYYSHCRHKRGEPDHSGYCRRALQYGSHNVLLSAAGCTDIQLLVFDSGDRSVDLL